MVGRQCNHSKFKYKMHVCKSVLTGSQRSALVTQQGEQNPVVCDLSHPAGVASAPPRAPADGRVGAGALTRDSSLTALLFSFLLHYLDCSAIDIRKRV